MCGGGSGGCRGPGHRDEIWKAKVAVAASTKHQGDIFNTRQNATVRELVPRAASQAALLSSPALTVARKKV
jgi:hypothetical protein